MKLFFAASQRKKNTPDPIYTEIITYLKKKKHVLLNTNFFVDSTTTQNADTEKKGQIDMYKHSLECIKRADVCIFECSVQSLGIGYQIEKSLYYNKPTIVIYRQKNIPYFLLGSDEEKLIVKSYKKANLVSILSSSLEEAKNLTNIRINFSISSSLLQYLHDVSFKMNLSKSTFIRKLILDHKKKGALS